MSRLKNNVIAVTPWAKLRAGRLYQTKVQGVRLDRASNCLEATVENLEPAQLGRIHKVYLPLPVRPGNRTCSFFMACGIEATAVGTAISLDQVANTIVGMRFRGPGPDGSEEFDFERISSMPATATNSLAARSGERKQTHDQDGCKDESQ